MAFRKTMYYALSHLIHPILWAWSNNPWTTKRRVKHYRRKCSRNSWTIWASQQPINCMWWPDYNWFLWL